MKISKSFIFFGIIFIFATMAALWGFSATDQEESVVEDKQDVATEESIAWDEETITDGDGRVLLTRDDVPDSMQVSEEAEFGTAGSFGSAVMSPDSDWVAFTIQGAAHDGGWLYAVDTGETVPVAFQYGGGLDVLEWSPNARFVAFLAESPANTAHILVVDKDNIDGYVAEISQQIEADEQADMGPPFAYEFVEWQSPQTLCYSFEEQSQECVPVETLFSNDDV